MSDYERIAEAINYITSHVNKQPSLDDVAKQLNLSPYHFQRLFTRWAGVSPKRFLQTLTVRRAKVLLKESMSLLETSNELGLSSTARLHDHFVKLEAITPGEYKSDGAGLKINYGVHETPFGYAFIAVTDRGVCQLSFIDDNNDSRLIVELEKKWSAATMRESKKITKPVINSIFSKDKKQPLSVYIQGTNFQINVWKALLEIPQGKLTTYGQLAKLIDNPKASRAVGSAVGANPVAFLIPCHRVIRASGVIGEYRWGSIRKRSMLCYETLEL
ncbi:MAG: methylated-DNA--[protein]-cysteine S-methyltransferase [Proteobacteria bacterium]|nr:methylated-DNA--[protein]-cysteine S-methyltransferase [Pseudomonadota bacterium]NOG60169.1 methylated-DNA--[protein]-cysteine S-methyltransferase [Pseudomonadota bacterium]